MAGDNIYAIAHNKVKAARLCLSKLIYCLLVLFHHTQTWLDGMQELRAAGVLIQHYYHQRNLTCIQRVSTGCSQPPECCVVPGGGIENKQ